MTPSVDFGRRATADELMDTEQVPFEDFRACLEDLARVNQLTLAYGPTLAFFERLRARGWPEDGPLRVVDVGSGYGDQLRRVRDWAAARGLRVELTGVALNPWSRRAAVEATKGAGAEGIDWVTADAFAYQPEGGIDVIISSLFTHHLGDEALVRFLSWMERTATRAWFVNDLHRHPVPYHFFRQWAKLAGWHRFVQHDGPLSIARAFSRDDWQRLLDEAGVDRDAVEIAWAVPFRWSLSRFKQPCAPR
jgi:SAM-dependent methyltransferase